MREILTGIQVPGVVGLRLCRGDFVVTGKADSEGFAGLVLEDDLLAGAWPTHHLATLATMVLQTGNSMGECMWDCVLLTGWLCFLHILNNVLLFFTMSSYSHLYCIHHKHFKDSAF